MVHTARIIRLLTTVFVAVVLVSAATPVCAMPDCGDVAAGTCSDFMPACDDCPESIVMKHSHDDATALQGHMVEPALVVAHLDPLDAPVQVHRFLRQPEATASPPPLDPLGMRLTI